MDLIALTSSYVHDDYLYCWFNRPKEVVLCSKRGTKQHQHVFVSVILYLNTSYRFLTNLWDFRHIFPFALDFACIPFWWMLFTFQPHSEMSNIKCLKFIFTRSNSQIFPMLLDWPRWCRKLFLLQDTFLLSVVRNLVIFDCRISLFFPPCKSYSIFPGILFSVLLTVEWYLVIPVRTGTCLYTGVPYQRCLLVYRIPV